MAEKGSATIEIKATPERILEVVTDIEAYPDRIDAFKYAEVLARDDHGRPSRARFEVDARIKVLEYELAYEYPADGIAWQKTSGDVKELTGSYRLEPIGDVTKVTYEYSIDPGFPVPGFLMRQGVKMMVSGALDDLKKTAER